MCQAVKETSGCSNLELSIIFSKDNPHPFSSVVPSQPALGVSSLHQAHLHHYTHPSRASSMQSMLWKPLTTTCRWLLFLHRCVQMHVSSFLFFFHCRIVWPWTSLMTLEIPSQLKLSVCPSQKKVMWSPWFTICFTLDPWAVELQPLHIWCQGAAVKQPHSVVYIFVFLLCRTFRTKLIKQVEIHTRP